MSLLFDAVRKLSEPSASGVIITPNFLDQISNRSDKEFATAVQKANKLISQLLAKSWFDENPDLFNHQSIVNILIDTKNINSSDQLDSVIDNDPYTPELWERWARIPPPPAPPAKNFEGYWLYSENPVILHLYTPRPNRPEQVSKTQLNDWINDTNEELQVPNIVWIPATC